MSEFPPSGVAQDAAVAGVPALTPEVIAAVLEDFRRWLTDVASGATAEPLHEEPGVDLFTLVGQFTALRQEVNLQTRAVRAQQEQNAETLRHLAEAVDALSQAPAAAPPGREPPANDVVRPLLKTLVDLYDAASLAGRELQRVQESSSTAMRVIEEAATRSDANESDEPDWRPPAAVQPSRWARWFGGSIEGVGASFASWKAEWVARRRREREAREEHLRPACEAAERIRQTLAATVAGYTMTLQRVERALAQHDLQPIPTVGQPFDPELMEVLEVVFDSGRPSGEVVEEVRRGYLWNGRIFRYAQVRVAKSNPQPV